MGGTSSAKIFACPNLSNGKHFVLRDLPLVIFFVVPRSNGGTEYGVRMMNYCTRRPWTHPNLRRSSEQRLVCC